MSTAPVAVRVVDPGSDPEFDPCREALRSFSRQGFMHHLGARMTAAERGRVELEVEFDPRLSQQHGFFHGGVVATLADVASGYAAYTMVDRQGSCVTVEFKVSFLAAARGPRLRARGTVLKRGRTLTVCRSEVISIADRGERLCATALATFMAVDGPEAADDEPRWRRSSPGSERDGEGR